MRSFQGILFTALLIFQGFLSAGRSESRLISIKNSFVPQALPGDISTWASLPVGLSMLAQSNGTGEVFSPYLVVHIRQGENVICGNTPTSGLAIAPFFTHTFSATELSRALNNCPKLNPGGYTICFQFFNDKNEAISNEECKEFLVAKANVENRVSTPPVHIAPADEQLFVAEEARQPISFKWVAVSPLPEGPITYRFRAWPMKAGQTMLQAMQQNQPAVVKDIKEGATTVTLNNELPMPCTAPYTCKYVWNVQALDAQGTGIGSNNGNSQPWALVIADYIIRINDIKVSCTSTPGVYSFSYILTNLNPGTAKLTNFVVTSSVPAGAVITTFTPPLNTNIASGGTLTITGTISASPTLSNICIGAEITDVGNTFWKASRDTCTPVLPCKCEACDPKKVNIIIPPTTNIVINANNSVTTTQPVTITTTPLKLVKSLKAELQYFEFVPESEECMPCNKETKTFGNMDNGTFATVIASGGGTHVLQSIYSPAKNFTAAQSTVYTFTIPPTVKCCSATIRWCVRYVITFNDCTVCSKIVCYEKKMDGCAKGNSNPNNN
jgi:hypothetical protein